MKQRNLEGNALRRREIILRWPISIPLRFTAEGGGSFRATQWQLHSKDPTPSMELHSREALAPVFAELNKYATTTHFVGQSTIFTLTEDRGAGEAYCLAYHVTIDGAERRLMVASLRYLDMFVKVDGSWLFAERLLFVDWTEERALSGQQLTSWLP